MHSLRAPVSLWSLKSLARLIMESPFDRDGFELHGAILRLELGRVEKDAQDLGVGLRRALTQNKESSEDQDPSQKRTHEVERRCAHHCRTEEQLAFDSEDGERAIQRFVNPV